MNTVSIQTLLRDIGTLPEDKLAELRQFVDFLRFKAETEKEHVEANNILQFAGSWQGMDNQVFEDFMSDIRSRRQISFKTRRTDETCAD